LLGGMVLGQAAGNGICSVVLGMASGGTRFFWCAIVAGTGGAVIGSKGASGGLGMAYEFFVEKDVKILALH
jgi:hypothetical protein